MNFYHTHSEDFYSLGRTFVLTGLFNLENTEEQETETVLENRSLSGLFTQLNFQYEKWLYLKLGGRGDWSSALGSRLNIYPSASAMLVWTEGLSSSLLSCGNLRLAWAKTGNLPAAERVRSVFERQQPDLFDALSYSLENLFEKAGLIPETSQDFEIGSNLHFLDHNLGFDINFYHRKSTNQILLKEISPGQEYQIVQQGRLINRGVELALYLPRTLKWGHWQWEAELTFYTNNSKLGDLKGLGVDSTGVLQGGGYWSTAQIRALDGQAYGAVYGFHYSRFGDLPPDHPNYLGQPFLIDEDGHPIRQLDRVLLGNTMPDCVMSLHSRIEYRNLSLGFLLERRRGGVVINGMKGHLVNTGQAMLTENRWYADADPYANARMVFEGISEDGNPNELAATLDNNYYSNTWARTDENLAEDGSWWRLRYIYFMYKIPIEGKKMKFLSEISVRLTIRNAWLLTKYSGIDPEVNALGALELPGYDEASVPNTRSWEIGFSVKF